MLKLVEYDISYLKKSGHWLSDPVIAELTMARSFTEKEQMDFYLSLATRKDYIIKGVEYLNQPIGAVGIKNINSAKGEYWGYIGEKQYWGKKLGGEMIRLISNVAKENSISYLYLYVHEMNLRAINLYKRQGFIEKSSENDLIFMEKYI